MIASIIGIVVLLVASAFFSGSETALTAASRARIHHLEQQGHKRARIVARLMERRERLIGTLLIGNNIVNILASSLATGVLFTLVGEGIAILLATLTMTALLVVFSEVLPKTYAIRNADKVSLLVAPVASVVIFVLTPLAATVQAIVSWILRRLGSKEDRTDHVAAEEELRGAISLHADSGAVVEHERAMLHSILDLDTLSVSDAMTHRRSMLMLDADLPAPELVERVMASSYTRMPVWRGEPDNIVGVLHAKDLLRALGAARNDPTKIDIAKILVKPWFVPETTTLLEQMTAFREKHAHFALVVDEYGALMGLITLEDILEEIVGDITDEHDIASRVIAPQADGSYLVLGSANIRDVNRRLGWNLSDEAATTIAGLMLHHAQNIPQVGESCDVEGFRFELVARQGNTLTQIRIRPARDVAPRDA